MDAIYARQSIDKKDSISIDTQIDMCQQHLEKGKEAKIYIDKGYSGSNTNRPGFQNLHTDIENGLIDRVIAYKLDRVSRSVVDFANLYAFFEKHNVTFLSTQESFDTTTAMGRAMLSIAMVFAELERSTIQKRVTDNYYARGEKGMFLGGPAPYGFFITQTVSSTGKLKHLAANEEVSKTLIRLFKLYGDENMSLGAIAKKLNEEAIPAPKGGKWTSEIVSRILRNPISVKADSLIYNYYHDHGCIITNEPTDFVLEHGLYIYGKAENKGRKYTDVSGLHATIAPHSGLIDSDLFLRCQTRLNNNAQIENRRQSQITWLSGLTKCSVCGRSTSPKASKGCAYRYFYCIGRTQYHDCDEKGNLGSMPEVEAIVEEKILAWSDRYSDLQAKVEKENNAEVNAIRCQIDDVNKRINKFIDNIVDEVSEVTRKYIDQSIQNLDAQRKSLEDELRRISDSGNKTILKSVGDLRNDWPNLSINGKSQIAHVLIERVLLSKGKLEIVWKYNFQ